MLDVGGEYAWRLRGEDHAWTPDSGRQAAARGARQLCRTSTRHSPQTINEQSERLLTMRGLMELKSADTPMPLDEVEPADGDRQALRHRRDELGSISREAHTTLAIAMNRIGGKSNTGEGGEESDRFKPLPNGDSLRSAIKQVASGRFGVTAEYLVNADEIQIKMAQGAKPGEGGQLPGHKVDENIARVRHSTPGVGLISPPPHHDIYSIEDLAQLIHDLKNVNPRARISVKLVSEVGVGTVAAGVAKARADHVTIAGYDGGTGASPLTSLKHAGTPWEIGLAETQQTLVLNGLRGRIAVQADGGMKTGRDVAIGALLGADEFGFATAPLIAEGCIMMRKCHLNTCPVGVATQDPVLRKRFTGKPEHVDQLLLLRRRGGARDHGAAGLPHARRDDRPRRPARHAPAPSSTGRRRRPRLQPQLLYQPPAHGRRGALQHASAQDHGLDKALDHELIAAAAAGARAAASRCALELPIRNVNRTVGAMLSGEVAQALRPRRPARGHDLTCSFTGTAGQSFGAFLARGVTLELIGDANDYVGKGLSGGRIVVRQPAECRARADREHHRRQHRAVRRDRRRGLFRRRGRRALRGAQLGRGRGGRRHRRPRLRIHDRRHRGRARRDRAQLRRRHVGRHRLRLRRATARFARAVQHGDGRARAGRRRRADRRRRRAGRASARSSVDDNGMGDMLRFDAERLRILIERHQLHTGSARARELLDDWDNALREVREGDARTSTSARCSRCATRARRRPHAVAAE